MPSCTINDRDVYVNEISHGEHMEQTCRTDMSLAEDASTLKKLQNRIAQRAYRDATMGGGSIESTKSVSYLESRNDTMTISQTGLQTPPTTGDTSHNPDQDVTTLGLWDLSEAYPVALSMKDIGLANREHASPRFCPKPFEEPSSLATSDVPQDGKTALHIAAESGRLSTVQLLLRLQSNVLAQDSIGRTSLHLAVLNQQQSVVEELRFTDVTGRKPHRFLRRGIVFSHRDLETILDKYERKEPFYLFTGRGPSSDSLHLGHSIPFEFTQWLQDVFNAPLIMMLTDDMKLLHSASLDVPTVQRYTVENAKDILAFAFNPLKTFMFSNLDFVGGAFYQNIIRVARTIKVSDIKQALGFEDEHNVGMFYCCSTQSAGTFATSFPDILGPGTTEQDRAALQKMGCLIACSWDIDGYFSEVRKHAEALGYQRAAFLYSSLLPSLQGPEAKMSASVPVSAVFLADDREVVRQKIELAFSDDASLNVETLFEYLNFFLDDDRELARLKTGFENGTVQSIELRESLIVAVQQIVSSFQENRARVTDDYLDGFMTRRLIR
ncbi:tryptophanyl-tRNA synthetase, partial [Aureobasidium melanogenum]